MAGLNCGVTLTLLGILLLGATRPRGGAGECGAASARGAEWPWWPESGRQAGRVWRSAGAEGPELELGQSRRGAQTARSPRDRPTLRRAASGAVAEPS